MLRRSTVARVLREALAGAVAGVALVLTEVFGPYRSALHGGDVAPSLALLVAAGILAVVLGSVGGLVHRWFGFGLLVVAAAAGGPEPAQAAGLALVAAAVGEAFHRRPRWIGGALIVGGGAAVLLVGSPSSTDPQVARPPATTSQQPDIVLVVLDTVGSASTSLHGAALDTTPTLESLAAVGTWFEAATAAAPWTVPSHAAMFTGRLPGDVGCHHEHPSLPDGVPTTAEVLAVAGYRTGSFVANPWVGDFNGLTRGFRHQESQWEGARAARAFSLLGHVPAAPSKGGAAMVASALSWLDGGGTQPAFAFVNLLEAHSPFQDTPDAGRYGVADPDSVGERTHRVQMGGLAAVPGYPEPGELDDARRVYAAGIRAVDDLVGVLWDGLVAGGRWDRTVFVVTSDHGEAFGEHGFHGHMLGLHAETVDVPLIVRVPGEEPAVVRAPVSTRRLHPTLLALAGVDVAGAGVPLPLGAGDVSEALVVSQQMRPVQVLADQKRATGDAGIGELDARAVRVREGELAVLREAPVNGLEARWSLYDLAVDPAETHDLWPTRQELEPERQARVDALVSEAEARAASTPGPPSGELAIESDLRDQLQALGYLGGE